MLDVEIKTVDGHVLSRALVKGTRASPALVVRTESLPQEIGKRLAVLDGGDCVVVRVVIVDTTNAEKNLDTTRLTIGDILLDVDAVVEQGRLDIILVVVVASPAVVSEVGSGIARRVILRSLVDKGQRDIFNASVTVVSQTVSAILTLRKAIESVKCGQNE